MKPDPEPAPDPEPTPAPVDRRPLELGDVVQVKGCAQPMTVEELGERLELTPTIKCVWWAGGSYRRYRFPEALLERVKL